MKTLYAVLAIFLSGCASVTVDTTDATGRDWHVKSTTLFKDVQGVEAEVGAVKFSLGSSSPTVQAEVIDCLIAPQLCQ